MVEGGEGERVRKSKEKREKSKEVVGRRKEKRVRRLREKGLKELEVERKGREG